MYGNLLFNLLNCFCLLYEYEVTTRLRHAEEVSDDKFSGSNKFLTDP